MAGRGGEIVVGPKTPDVRQPVRRARPESAPRPDAGEILAREIRIVAGNGLDDSLHATLDDVLAESHDLHRAAEAQASAHRRDRDSRLRKNRANLRELPRARERER